MNILVINCGSSSLKYQLVDSASEATLAKEPYEKIGVKGSQIAYQLTGREKEVIVSPMPTHTQTIQMVLGALIDDKTSVTRGLDEVETIGHGIVHGREASTTSTSITEDAIKAIEECSGLAPFHNSANLIGIRVYQELMPNTPMVGMSDTAFHQTIPEKTYLYGLLYKYCEKYEARRYSSHGTSHSYVLKGTVGILGRPYDSLKTVVYRLGNGSSISVVPNGKPVGTSMELAPLEGLVMRTRSSNVDPGTLQLIMHKEDVDIGQTLSVLDKESGVYGMSGVSSDSRDMENAADKGNKRTETTLESFVYCVVEYVGAYTAATSGTDAITFIADVGENDKITRRKVRECPAFLRIGIGDEADSKRRQGIAVSAPGSEVGVLVVPTNGESTIAREASALVR